jgi:hypothetical protein
LRSNPAIKAQIQKLQEQAEGREKQLAEKTAGARAEWEWNFQLFRT